MPEAESSSIHTGFDESAQVIGIPSTETIRPERDVATLYAEILTDRFVELLQEPWTGHTVDLFQELCLENHDLNSDLFVMGTSEQLALHTIAQATWRARAVDPKASLKLLSSMELRIFAATVTGDLSSEVSNLVAGGLDRREATIQAIYTELKAVSDIQNEEYVFGNQYLPAVGIEIESRLGRRDPGTGDYILVNTLREGHKDVVDLVDRSRRYPDIASLPMFKANRELFTGKSGGDVDEIVTRPYVTPEALLGDVAQLYRAGLVPERKSCSVHITIGDLYIGRNDLRPMLISMMVWAEGYAGAYKNKGSVVREGYDKGDFPFHKPKTVFNSDIVVGPVRQAEQSYAVEFRSLWKAHSQEDLKHVVDDLYYLSVPLVAQQRREKDNTHEALARIWAQTEDAFVSLLSTYNIDTDVLFQIIEKIRVTEAAPEDDAENNPDMDSLKEVYGRILGSIRTLQRTVPEFRAKARRLVSESKRAVMEVLNGSESVNSII